MEPGSLGGTSPQAAESSYCLFPGKSLRLPSVSIVETLTLCQAARQTRCVCNQGSDPQTHEVGVSCPCSSRGGEDLGSRVSDQRLWPLRVCAVLPAGVRHRASRAPLSLAGARGQRDTASRPGVNRHSDCNTSHTAPDSCGSHPTTPGLPSHLMG